MGRAVHADVDCEVCNTLLAQSKGGRQKTAKKCGRLNRESSKALPTLSSNIHMERVATTACGTVSTTFHKFLSS